MHPVLARILLGAIDPSVCVKAPHSSWHLFVRLMGEARAYRAL